MSAHTPGPWIADIFDSGAFAIFAVTSDRDVLIAQRAPSWEHMSEASKANAYLIAASPQMHDALTAVRATLIRLDRGFLNQDEALDLVREALPKEPTEAPERY